MTEGPDRCQLQEDALQQAEIDFNQALQTLTDRAEALLRCREENPESPPAPMAMAERSKQMRIESHAEEIRACVAAIVRIVKE